MQTRSYDLPGLHVREHRVAVPLRWDHLGGPGAGGGDGEELGVFVRELVDPDRRDADLPLLLFLQGGPGGPGPRPTDDSGWIGRALKTHRLLLLDQRGTGRSSRVTAARLGAFTDPRAAAEHLLRFRADSIVADAEHVRATVAGGRTWSTLGQSYGGFLTLTYLSTAPRALERCLVTGGLPGLAADADEVYRRTYPRVVEKTRRYYERYPDDAARVGAVADALAAEDVRLPDGDRLTVRRLQTLGFDLGMGPSPERMHWIFEDALTDDGPPGTDGTGAGGTGSGGTGSGGPLSDGFLDAVARRTSYWDNPLYAALQEVIYASGTGATAWAAERERAHHPGVDPAHRPLGFTGEMVYPWMFEEIASLRPFAAATEALARVEEHSVLYDPARLAANEVPVDAAVYFDDAYVDAGLSLETAAAVGNTRTWVTNEFEHDGLRNGDVLDRLFRLRR